jgi:hypothetical protein
VCLFVSQAYLPIGPYNDLDYFGMSDLEELYDRRLSRTVLSEAWGETPLAYSTLEMMV